MLGRAEYERWLSTLKGPRVELIEGLRPGRFLPGSLSDPEVKRGDPVRAGGYGEDRSNYTQPLFAPEGEEPRTVHLGLDVFADPGAEVLAPLNGRTHSMAINAKPGDYGPTLILEHHAGGGTFFTLYGHLSRDSLKGRKIGDSFMAGEPIGTLGRSHENGGWPAHVHFQVILDIGKWRGDFPGVCKSSERDHWLSICPDPRPLLGLPVA
jgi:murein DD-endopeptidase MepM/ murein hydrolase activator NlpD